MVGDVVGGFILTALGASGVTGFNFYSLVVAVIGAVVVLVIYHAIVGRRRVGVLKSQLWRRPRCDHDNTTCPGDRTAIKATWTRRILIKTEVYRADLKLRNLLDG